LSGERSILIADILDEDCQRVATELGTASAYVHADVSESQVAQLVDVATEPFGRLDVMVINNAGVIELPTSIVDTLADDFQHTLTVDLLGVLYDMKHAARAMRTQANGVIVSIASPGAVVGGLGAHPCSAAKAGVLGLTRSVSADLRAFGLRVDAIIPRAVVTPMTAHLRTGDLTVLKQAEAQMGSTARLGRPGHPQDISAAVAYLASEDAVFVTVNGRSTQRLTTAPNRTSAGRSDNAADLAL
jgi:NAD(P)-dependent dehydrogenase (short-subunit alcohol dehydrogenase family)